MRPGTKPPAPGWLPSEAPLVYRHPAGGRVYRATNPATGLIEWAAHHPAGRTEYCGQDLQDALASATEELLP